MAFNGRLMLPIIRCVPTAYLARLPIATATSMARRIAPTPPMSDHATVGVYSRWKQSSNIQRDVVSPPHASVLYTHALPCKF